MKRQTTRTAFLIATISLAPFALAGSLSTSPLFLQTAVPSNVLFSLSVEFPTAVSAAYRDTYTSTTEYLGYFDSAKCYTYDSTNSWFSPAGLATARACSNKWSGNFLNWATMTGLDEFRYAMTGGNRYRDTSTLTVLERTYIDSSGSTGNFPNKTYTGTDTNPYPSGSSLTIANAQKGTQMTVTLGGTGTANCTNPTLTGSDFSCTLALAGTGEAGSCSSWAGNGTVGAPYQCNTFGSFADSGTPNSATAVTPPTTGSATSNDSVSCSNPLYSSSSPNFTCTLTNSANITGNCTTWAGSGTANDPYKCGTFGSFASATFAASTQTAATSFTATADITQAADTVTSCSIATSSPYRISCNLTSGRTTTCTPSGDGQTGSGHRPYNCTSSSNGWTISGSPAATYVTNANSATTSQFTNSNNKTRYYYKPTSVTYSTPQTSTKYYVPSYTGSDTIAYYYYANYNINFGGSTTYDVRTKVCVNDNSAGGLESNCTPYGTSYKPTGVIQQYGEQMRFGTFSYFNSSSIDNAVMRSKLKYVAPNKWTPSGTTVSNSNREWSSTDGTYTTNPDPTEASGSYGGAVTNSGVINYVNKFGSTGSGAKRYKSYDPAGKLYYESLKYLRGLEPTAAFYNGVTSTNNDNFPVITSWDDPVQYSCQKNFVIFMGDKNTHCDKRLPGGTLTPYGASWCAANANSTTQIADQGSLSGDAVDVSSWTTSLGTLEGVANLGSTTTGSGNNGSYYMAGLAYWAAKNGIRPMDDLTDHEASNTPANNIKVKTFVIDVQEGGAQGVGSQYWKAAKYGGVDSFDASGNPLNWSTTISDYNGAWPKALLPAGNPVAMIAAVRGALATISAQTGTGSDIGLSTGDLRTGAGINLYSVSYNSNGWSGDVVSYRMNTDLTINATAVWSASTTLSSAALNPASGTKPWMTRKIITYNDGLDVDGTATTTANGRRGVDFKSDDSGTDVFSVNFSPRQQAFLNTDPGSNTADGRGDFRVDYLRGDNSNEGSNGFNWRSRASALGDFVNSSAVYVSIPTTFVNGSDYATYATNVATRTPMLYAGSNNGMLHAFNADANSNGTAKTDSGKEVFAYVPSAVYSNLNKLSWTNYAHRYFVDSTPVVADAQLTTGCSSGSDTNKCWRTILAGGLGAGGQGVYALNITDPSTFASATASSLLLWEFTDRDDADLGYTFAQPYIAKMNNGKWAVIIGNGYNSTDGDNDVGNVNRLGSGRAYLYILYLDGPGVDISGRGNTWTLNTHYRKIELKSPTEATTTAKNGLSTANGIDYNNDGTVDYLYAGDRHGNLWKIDVSDTDPANWASDFGTTADPTPLFTAVTADNTPVAQQTTTSPLVSRHPNGGFMVLFGTGSYVDQSDTTPPFSTNSFYGIWDKNDGTTTVSGRSALQKQATLAKSTVSGQTYVLQSNCTPQYNSTATSPAAATATCPSSLAPATNGAGEVDQQLGWVLDLNNSVSGSASGERYISSVLPILTNGLLTFVTLTPSGDLCQGGGYDFQYDLDYRTGGAFASPIYFSVSGTTVTPLQVSFTTGSGASSATANYYPSGQRLTTAIGQNPKEINFQTDRGSNTPTDGGCSNFVKGRPCEKKKMRCLISTPASGCRNGFLPSTGRVSWRQLNQ